LNYWKKNSTPEAALANSQGTSYPQITFTRRPAEAGVTHHVQISSDLSNWSEIASYSGTNGVLTPQAQEISRTGAPNETVTVRGTAPLGQGMASFLRVQVTTP